MPIISDHIERRAGIVRQLVYEVVGVGGDVCANVSTEIVRCQVIGFQQLQNGLRHIADWVNRFNAHTNELAV